MEQEDERTFALFEKAKSSPLARMRFTFPPRAPELAPQLGRSERFTKPPSVRKRI